MKPQPFWSFVDVVAAVVALIAFLILCHFCGGCVETKASHQNGIVLYASTSGQFGVGYGETEDMPGGCVYHKMSDIVTVTDSSWLFGASTNHTITVIDWDTRAMVTNRCHCAVSPSANSVSSTASE